MNTTTCLTTLLITSLFAGSLVSPARAEIVLQDLGGGCYLIDFEGVGNLEEVGTVPGPSHETQFGYSWLGAIDQDAGGSGYFANEPSPNTATMPLYNQANVNVSWTGGLLPQSVQFRYTAGGITVGTLAQAFQWPGGALLDEVPLLNGAASGGAGCSGDPTGDLCEWHTITFAADGNAIGNIYFSGWMFAFAMDDMVICFDPDQAVPCCLPSGECAMLSPAACEFASGMPRPGSECTETMCTALPVEHVTWGTIKSVYRD